MSPFARLRDGSVLFAPQFEDLIFAESTYFSGEPTKNTKECKCNENMKERERERGGGGEGEKIKLYCYVLTFTFKQIKTINIEFYRWMIRCILICVCAA